MAQHIDIAIPSSEISKKLPGLKMEEDPRLHRLEAQIQKEIKENGWKVPRDEEKICERITTVMHQKDYYGPYDNKSLKMQADLKQMNQRLENIEIDKKSNIPDNKKLSGEEKIQKLAELEKEKEQLTHKKDELAKKLNDYTEIHNSKALKDTKSGETVCQQQAAIMSHVMNSVGLKNDVILGVGPENGRPDHAYVQSRSAGRNIIDPATATTLGFSYLHNRNGGDISKGEVVVVRNETSGSIFNGCYGGGKFPNWLEQRRPDKDLYQRLNGLKSPEEILHQLIYHNQQKAEDALFDKEHKNGPQHKDTQPNAPAPAHTHAANNAAVEAPEHFADVHSVKLPQELVAHVKVEMHEDAHDMAQQLPHDAEKTKQLLQEAAQDIGKNIESYNQQHPNEPIGEYAQRPTEVAAAHNISTEKYLG